MVRLIPALTQYFDDTGEPLAGGKLHFTVSGTNDTDKDTFADAAGVTANANPVILDSAGRAPDIFGEGTYRITVFDSDDVQIDQKDPVTEDNSPGGLADWSTLETYIAPDLVVGSDLKFYRSIVNDNESNNPVSSPEAWERIEFFSFYNAAKTYAEFDRCIDADTGLEYISLVADNVGNTPSTSASDWRLENSEQIAAIALNTAKVGITTQQAADITTNNAKVGITTTQADTLDTISYGTFTPSVGITGGLSLTSSEGTYQEIGNLVTFNAQVVINSILATVSGQLSITGLPFAAVRDTPCTGRLENHSNLGTGPTSIRCKIATSATAAVVEAYNLQTSSATNLGSFVIAGSIISVSGTYEKEIV